MNLKTAEKRPIDQPASAILRTLCLTTWHRRLLHNLVFAVLAIGLGWATIASWESILGWSTAPSSFLSWLVTILMLSASLFILIAFVKTPPRELLIGFSRFHFIYILLFSILLCILSFSALSTLLQKSGLAMYTIKEGTFQDYYYWLLLDSIPILNITGMLGLEAPGEAANTLSSALEELFKVFIVGTAIQQYSKKNITPEEALKAARKAMIEDQLDLAKKGILTKLTEEGRLVTTLETAVLTAYRTRNAELMMEPIWNVRPITFAEERMIRRKRFWMK
jgi:hypothetical protein